MVGVQLHDPASLSSLKKPLVPTEQDTGCAPETVWTLWREGRNTVFLLQIEKPFLGCAVYINRRCVMGE
jgi:hypothetical protein